MGGAGNRPGGVGGIGQGGTGRGEERRGRDGLGPVGLQFCLSPVRPVDRLTGLKARPDSSLRPNFYGPDGPTRPVGDPYLELEDTN